MRLEIFLEPPGVEAENVMRDWLAASSLIPADNNRVEVDPADCFELLVELRRRCYDRGVTVDVKFFGNV
ncbi:MAG: hypothetical protein P1P81_11515 [Desulfobulbales bacterium]|nr:hypothetical protein [Desulfobulbales bacterium]